MAQLTVKQSVAYSGKSENTIRRLIKKYSMSTHDNAQYFHKRGGKHYIDRDFLKKLYNVPDGEKKKTEETQLNFSLVEHLKEQNIELNARVKELTHVVAHQSQQLANKDEQLRLLSAAPTEPESSNTSTYFIVLMVVIAVVIGTMIIGMILNS